MILPSSETRAFIEFLDRICDNCGQTGDHECDMNTCSICGQVRPCRCPCQNCCVPENIHRENCQQSLMPWSEERKQFKSRAEVAKIVKDVKINE